MADLLFLSLWFAGLAVTVLACHLGVTRVFGAGLDLRVRAVATLVVLLAGQYLAGLALLLLGAFGPAALVALFVLAAGFAGWTLRSPELRGLLAADFGRVRAATIDQPVSAWMAWILAVPALIFWLHVVRGTLTPPLDWDFLTYHGPRAVFWVQEGTLWPSYDAVGLWQFYRAFPIAGDLLSAWAMLLPSGDVAVAPSWTLVWVALGLTGHAAIRSLGGSRPAALLGAAVAVSLPACLHHMSSGYVDNLVALTLLAGIVLFIEAERTGRMGLAGLALAAWAVALATKLTALPFLGLGALLWLWLLLRNRRAFTDLPVVVSVVGVGLLALAWPAILILEFANPLYPFTLSVLGIDLPGTTAPARELAGSRIDILGFTDAARALFREGFHGNPLLHNGFGPGGLIVMIAGLVSLWTERGRTPLVFLLSFGGALLFLLWILATRIGGPGLDDARYILIAGILGAVAVARCHARWAVWSLAAAGAANAVYAMPWRWSDLDAILLLVCMGAGAVLACLVLFTALGRRQPWRPALLFAVASLAVAVAIGPQYRHKYYAGAGLNAHFGSGPLAATASAQSFPIWSALAADQPRVVAVAAGTSPLPTHWFIYPLFGDRLQHRLRHVATGLYYRDERDGVSGPDLARAGQRWLSELDRGAVDLVMLYAPDPVERGWVRANPERFRGVAEGRLGQSGLYAVLPSR